MLTVNGKKVPERKCVGCGEKKPKGELIRIVRLSGTDVAKVDFSGKKEGRGAYICRDAQCLKKARKKLEAHLECKISDEVFENLEKEIKG